LTHWFNDLRVRALRCHASQQFGSSIMAESGLMFPSAEFTRSMIQTQREDGVGKEKPKKPEKPTTVTGGIHSEEYKAMRAKLAKYAEESRAFLTAHGSSVSAKA